MGGKTDATNVIKNTELAVITSISMDHMEYLGDTLEKIARQKAGIIKPGASVVTCSQQTEAAKEIERVCRQGGNLLTVGRVENAEKIEADLEHQTFSYGGQDHDSSGRVPPTGKCSACSCRRTGAGSKRI